MSARWVVLAALLAAACARRPSAPQTAPATQPTAPVAPAAAPVTPAATPDAGLRLLAVVPRQDAPLLPGGILRVVVDRPLSPTSLSEEAARLEYVASRRRFVVDPFRYTARRLEPWGAGWALTLDPPDVLPGEIVRLTLGPALRGDDGTTLAEIRTAGALSFDFVVPALPPEAP